MPSERDDAIDHRAYLRWEDGHTETVTLRPGDTVKMSCGCAMSWDKVMVTPGTLVPAIQWTMCEHHMPDEHVYLTGLVPMPVAGTGSVPDGGGSGAA